jgi:DNA-binding phage protein
LKTMNDFAADVTALYDAVHAAIEETGTDREITNAEVMCVLSGLLCTVATEAGMSKEDLISSLSLNFACQDDTDSLVH